MKSLTNFKTISKTLIAAVALSVALVACSKDDDDRVPQPVSGLNVIQASPTTKKIDFYIEGTRVNNHDFTYTDKIGYLNLFPGSRELSIRESGSSKDTLSESFNLEPQVAYSLFIIDKFENVKFLMLKDSVATPASGKAVVRFVNLSPDAPALNLAVAGKEEDLFTGKSFKEYTPFEQIDASESVTFNITEVPGGTPVATIPDVRIEQGRAYTIWVKGLKSATEDDMKLGAVIYTH